MFYKIIYLIINKSYVVKKFLLKSIPLESGSTRITGVIHKVVLPM